MKSLRLTFAFILFLLFSFACSDPDDPTTPIDPGSGNPPPGSGASIVPTQDVLIQLPEGAKLDMSKMTLSTGLMSYPVTAQGISKAVLPDSSIRVSYLFDESNKLILMGILNKDSKVISPETTAQALAYLGLGVNYLPTSVVREFLKPQQPLSGYDSFKTKVISGMSADILYVDNQKFEQDLIAFANEFRKEGDVLDIRARQIDRDPIGFLSGVEVFENDGVSIKIANTYRRRAYAFIYKTAYKAKGSKEMTVIKPTIAGKDVAEITSDVEPSSAFGGVLGTINDWVSFKAIEYARKETDAITLPLKDDEDEAIYKVRVIGSSFNSTSSVPMTEKESERWKTLMIKQYYLDLVFPVFAELYSELNADPKGNLGFDTFEFILTQAPWIWDAIEKGDWKKAIEETLKFINNDKLGPEIRDRLVKEIVDHFKKNTTGTLIDLNRDFNNAKTVERYLKVLKLIDLAGKVLDAGRLTNQIAMSSRIDVFTATAKRGDVTINPRTGTVVPNTNFPLTAESKTILPSGASFVYKWKTTGKYGVVSFGNQKGPEIVTSNKTVNFRSEAKPADLGENNYETVTVEVFLKQGNTETFVGEGKSTINVKKLKLVMKPDDITLDGKKKQSVKLYLERTDYVNDIVTIPNTIEYKVEWSTAGTYGKFNGTNNNATSKGNSIVYQALDDKVKEGIESITAKVYFKTPESDWVFREEVKGKVKVVNDPKKVVLDVALVTKDWSIPDGQGISTGVNLLAMIPIHPKAVKYTVKFYGFKKPNPWENKSVSWIPGQTPPMEYGFPQAGPNQIVGDNYYFTVGSTWCAGKPENCLPKIPGMHAFYAPFGGKANIVIEITD
jgi:hypothetical protein